MINLSIQSLSENKKDGSLSMTAIDSKIVSNGKEGDIPFV
jgi:hypothetical protein